MKNNGQSEVYDELVKIINKARRMAGQTVKALNKSMFGERSSSLKIESITDVRHDFLDIHSDIKDRMLRDYIWTLQDLILMAENNEAGWGAAVEEDPSEVKRRSVNPNPIALIERFTDLLRTARNRIGYLRQAQNKKVG